MKMSQGFAVAAIVNAIFSASPESPNPTFFGLFACTMIGVMFFTMLVEDRRG